MDVLQAIKERHSVRFYIDKPIEKEKADELKRIIDETNRQSGLNIQLILNEPNGFSGTMAHYGSFSGVSNYIVMAGPKHMDREIGYYGEKIVLAAQMLGLNTCWVALTFNKRKAVYSLSKGEKMYVVISLGYGATRGKPHKSKNINEISDLNESSPEWYKKGIEAVILAPTAVNQQKFHFALKDGKVVSKADRGFYTVMDLGIAQYHFDAATGENHFGLKG